MIKNESTITEKQSMVFKDQQSEKTFAELLKEKLPKLIQEHWISLHTK